MNLNPCKCGSTSVVGCSNLSDPPTSFNHRCNGCGRSSCHATSEEKSRLEWNAENPIPERSATCCQCGCVEYNATLAGERAKQSKATPAPSTPVWNVHLKDGRVATVQATHHDLLGERLEFLMGTEDFSVVSLFWSKDIDFIARDGVVEIDQPKSEVQAGGGECFENYCLRNNVTPEMEFAYHAWIADRKKTASKNQPPPTVEDVQKIYREMDSAKKTVLCRFEILADKDEDHPNHVALSYQSLDWPSGGLLMHVSLDVAIDEMVAKARKVSGRY